MVLTLVSVDLLAVSASDFTNDAQKGMGIITIQNAGNVHDIDLNNCV